MALLGGLFLTSLDWAQTTRRTYPFLIYLLPIAGFGMAYAYHRWGTEISRGNNLVIQQINFPKGTISWLMAPFIFFSTIATHLFGGSAGREGTAIQMGASVADQLSLFFKHLQNYKSIILKCGVAAGFSAVFGTPLAALFFAFEFSKQKIINIYSFLPIAFSSFLAFYFTKIAGLKHSEYSLGIVPSITITSIFWTLISGVVFGLCAWFFCIGMEFTQKYFEKIKYPPFRTCLGGLVFVGIVVVFGTENTEKYHGLGLDHIALSFSTKVSSYDFLIKMILTLLVLGSGFKGGEVTPLFFIGATLGSALSAFIPIELGLLAAMGFIAVFSAAAKTPLACIIMGAELFGFEGSIYFILVCFVAFFVSGKKGIYKVVH